MLEFDRKEIDIVKLLCDVELMQCDVLQGVLVSDIFVELVIVDVDQGMMWQVFINLLKNVGEVFDEMCVDLFVGWQLQVCVQMQVVFDVVMICIIDNGIGLFEDCLWLFEFYVMMKQGGIGLGLFICKKIVEEYGGSLILGDVFGQQGVMVEICLF